MLHESTFYHLSTRQTVLFLAWKNRTVSFELTHKNTSFSACPKDQQNHLTYDMSRTDTNTVTDIATDTDIVTVADTVTDTRQRHSHSHSWFRAVVKNN